MSLSHVQMVAPDQPSRTLPLTLFFSASFLHDLDLCLLPGHKSAGGAVGNCQRVTILVLQKWPFLISLT